MNYRIIGFSFPADNKAISYEVEVAAGVHDNDLSFKKNILISEQLREANVVFEVPSFGADYTWRVIYKYASASKQTGYYHFAVGTCVGVDTIMRRLRIDKNSGKYNNMYLFLDNSKILYDMSGRAVWFLPAINEVINDRCMPRDMKLTSSGTITMLALDKAYEISYDGKILWSAPVLADSNGDSIGHYHHEFTKLANGHYMIMASNVGGEMGKANILNNGQQGTQSVVQGFEEGKLIEFDQQGKIVWSWKTSDYFFKSDLVNRKLPSGAYNTDLHDNGFWFDEHLRNIYISFRNINRIIKISYPEGKLLAEYGAKYVNGNPGEEMFCGQHNVRRSSSGLVYLFNNNTCHMDQYPKVTIIKEPQGPAEKASVVWEYECTNEGMGTNELQRARSMSGGSVEELEDGAMLVCMGTPCSKIFIISKDKEIQWSGFPEMRAGDRWRMVPLYRVSAIHDRKSLEKLIWFGHKY